jgi:hypothetical protein
LTQPLRFNTCTRAAKDDFFAALSKAPFTVRAVVARKSLIASPRLRADEARFQRLFVNRMLSHGRAALEDARVVVDRSCDRSFRKELALRLSKRTSQMPHNFAFAPPQSDLMLQLADMCAGAIARAFRSGPADATRWRDLLGARLEQVWEVA